MDNKELIGALYGTTDTSPDVLNDKNVAYIAIDHNSVLGLQDVPGLHVVAEEQEEGVKVAVSLDEGVVLEKTVHLCFGMFPESGVQRIDMVVDCKPRSSIAVLAHCIFPNAVDVQHIMDARIHVGAGAHYSYIEKHVHGREAGVKVYPKARIVLDKDARFRTEFELLRGRVGLIDIDYEAECLEGSVLEMTARISGIGNDIIRLRESGHLHEKATGVLTSKIAVRDSARAEIFNKLTASGAYARGHVDCKEIVQDKAVATATPIVEVSHPLAHVTHEAAIGSVDTSQLETLMARGLSEDDAVELIINGLLGK